jgi:choline-glycine betaine transporter
LISHAHYLRTVRASAWYDLVVTIGFATPWTFALVHHGLTWVVQTLELPGTFPAFETAHMLMANLLGSVVTVWAIVRIRHAQLHLGRYDAAARFLFAAWQIYAVAQGANVIILGFTVAEVIFGVLQSLPVKQVLPQRARQPVG